MNQFLEPLRGYYAGKEPGLLGAKSAYAVLCPLVEGPEGLGFLYEVRAAALRQGGEVCFPGGRMEAGETPVQCALRETWEELSIPPESVEVIGLTDFICNPRGFLLQPVLGLVAAEGYDAMRPSPAEVAETFTVPLSFFRDTPPAVYGYDLVPQVPEDFPYEAIGVAPDYPWSRGKAEVPVWRWQGRAIWGMTARITRDIVRHIKK